MPDESAYLKINFAQKNRDIVVLRCRMPAMAHPPAGRGRRPGMSPTVGFSTLPFARKLAPSIARCPQIITDHDDLTLSIVCR
jgi:hypothetical protein